MCVDDSGGGGVGVGGGWVIIIFQGVLTKSNLLMKFQHLKKLYFLAFWHKTFPSYFSLLFQKLIFHICFL